MMQGAERMIEGWVGLKHSEVLDTAAWKFRRRIGHVLTAVLAILCIGAVVANLSLGHSGSAAEWTLLIAFTYCSIVFVLHILVEHRRVSAVTSMLRVVTLEQEYIHSGVYDQSGKEQTRAQKFNWEHLRGVEESKRGIELRFVVGFFSGGTIVAPSAIFPDETSRGEFLRFVRSPDVQSG
jgi:hypothetical protein